MTGESNSVTSKETTESTSNQSQIPQPQQPSSSAHKPNSNDIKYNQLYYLPFPKSFKLPNYNASKEPVLNPGIIPESCAGKIILGGIMGSVLGVGIGLFTSMMSDVSPIQIVNGREVPQAPLREQVRIGFKSLGSKSSGWAKSFGILTALFGGIECLIEKHRAKHDVWNPVVGGCVVGATLSAKAGPAVSFVLSLGLNFKLKNK